MSHMDPQPPAADVRPAVPATELAYAPHAKDPRLPVVVLVWGLITTGLSLAGVWALSAYGETNVMGWYANAILPVGALLVGAIAGCGYGIASWASGVRIRKWLLWTILGLQLVAYFSAQFIDFVATGPYVEAATNRVITFPEYFHYNAVEFAWIDKRTGQPGEPLGGWGYFFRMLELLGFAAGGIIAPAVLYRAPYCELCQVYMKTRLLAIVPMSVPVRKVSRKDSAATEAYLAEQAQAVETGKQQLEAINTLAQSADPGPLQEKLTALAAGNKAAGKLPIRGHVSLVFCRRCRSGHLKEALLRGQGQHTATEAIGEVPLAPDVVQALATIKV